MAEREDGTDWSVDAAYPPTRLHYQSVRVAPVARYAAPFKPYVYRGNGQSFQKPVRREEG